MPKTKPLQILFKGEVMDVIEKLKKHSDAASRAEVVRDAIRLYEILDQLSNGRNLVVKSEGSKEERIVSIPRKRPTVV